MRAVRGKEEMREEQLEGFGSGAKKGEVEKVGRVKWLLPMRVRLDKAEVEGRGRGRVRGKSPWVRVQARPSEKRTA